MADSMVYPVVCSTQKPVIGIAPKRYDITAADSATARAVAVMQYQTYTKEWSSPARPLPVARIATEILDTYQEASNG